MFSFEITKIIPLYNVNNSITKYYEKNSFCRNDVGDVLVVHTIAKQSANKNGEFGTR